MALKAFEVFGQVSLRGEQQVKRGLKGMVGGAGGLSTAFAVGAAAVAAAAGAAIGAAAHFASLAEEEATANARIANITESMGLFGDQASTVSDRLIDLARSQALSTGIADNTIKETQALLMTFRGIAESADEAGGAFDRASAAALDMSAAGFGAPQDAAKQLGKALDDPIRGLTALRRSGVSFTEAEEDMIKAMVEAGDIAEAQDMILSAIEKQVGGTAEATANWSDRAKVAFNEIKEGLGARVLPLFEGLARTLVEDLLPTFDKLMSGDLSLKDLIPPQVIAAFETLKSIFGPAIDTITESIAEMKANMEPALASLKNAWEQLKPIVEIVGGAIAAVVAVILGVVIGLVNGITNAINGIARVVGGVVATIAGVVNLVIGIITGDGAKIKEAWEGIKQGIVDIFGGLWDAVKGFLTGFVDGVVSFFTGLWDTLVGHSIIPDMINGIIDWFASLPGKSAAVLVGFINSVTAAFRRVAVTAITAVERMISSVIGRLRASPIFGPITDAVESAIRLVARMRDTFVRVIHDLLAKLRSPIASIKGLLDKLNPFHRESPSLVDNVLAGTKLIRERYAGLSGLDIAGPSVGGIGAGGASAPTAPAVYIIADPRYTDMGKLRREAASWARQDIGQGAIRGRMRS